MRFIDEMIDRKRREARRTEPRAGESSPEAGPPPGFDRSDLPAPLNWPPQPVQPLADAPETPGDESASPASEEAAAPRIFGSARASGTDARTPSRPLSGPARPIPMPGTATDDRPTASSARPVSATPLQLVDPVLPGREPRPAREGSGAFAPEEDWPEDNWPEADAPEADPSGTGPEPDDLPAELRHAAHASTSGDTSEGAPAAAPTPAFLEPEPQPAERAAPLAGPDLSTAGPDMPIDPPASGASTADALSGRLDAPRSAGRVKTRLLGFRAPDAGGDPLHQPRPRAAAAPPARFPVGWLVVERGPGRGTAFALFDGLSTIGRGEGQTVQLDLGDTAISRDTHAAIAYDDENRACYLGHGGKANLVRLNGHPVLTTEALSGGDRIRIGETTLRFVALCGPEFSWSDAPDEDEEAASDAAAL